jgi:xanthine dehydrogenase accessory factor
MRYLWQAMEILRAALELEPREPHALVTVIGVSGSTPRHVGARMMVSARGQASFTIGGGRVEKELCDAGARVARGGAAERVKHHLVRDLAMCCGGSMEFYVEPLAPSLSTIARAVELYDRREAFVLATNLAGGGKEVREAGAERRPELADGFFLEPVWPQPRLVLFGCGHVSRAVGPLARSAGFSIVVCDDNQTGAIEEAPPWADFLVPSFALRDVDKEAGGLGQGDYLVILTRDHAIDEQIVESCLLASGRFDYVGLIGSQGKVGRFRKRLFARGRIDEEQWQRLHAPIGIDIAAETPEEIAVSIVAELIATKNRWHRG